MVPTKRLDKSQKSAPHNSSSGKAMQQRGIVRREKLQDAAIDLLNKKDLDDVTFLDITHKAKIPTGSAYHFYANKLEVFAALGARYGEILRKDLGQLDDREWASWQDILCEMVDKGFAFYQKNPAAQQILISGKTPSSIKLTDRGNDMELAWIIENQIEKYFVIPDIPSRTELFFRWVEIVDLFFTLSYISEGKITPEMCDEAKRAANAYIRTYLPEVMPKRS